MLRSKWVVVGAALALLIWSPNVVWQATHGWPQIDMARAIAREDGAENRAELIPLQLLLLGPLLLPIWGAGLLWLWRSDETKPLRPLAFTYPVLLVAVFIGAGKSYYVVPILLVYLAAGCVVVERWMTKPRRVIAVGALVTVSAVTSAIITLPLLPAKDVGGSPVAALNDDALETIGWPEFTALRSPTWSRRCLPISVRARSSSPRTTAKQGRSTISAGRSGFPARTPATTRTATGASRPTARAQSW